MEFEFCETKFELKSKNTNGLFGKDKYNQIVKKKGKAYNPQLSRLEIDADSQDESRQE